MNAAADFAAHLTTLAKTEWQITHGDLRFVLERTEPDPAERTWCVNPRKPKETIHGWRLSVIADNGERVQLNETTGTVRNIRSEQGPIAGACAKANIERMQAKMRWYAEAFQQLTVMVDQLLAGPKAETKKAAKLREAALMDLRYHRLICTGTTVGLVAGDAVLIVSERAGAWVELTYHEGDEAIHNSYNLAYIGTITSISSKTITIVDGHGEKVRRLKHDEFVRRNERPISEAKRRNSEWMD